MLLRSIALLNFRIEMQDLSTGAPPAQFRVSAMLLRQNARQKTRKTWRSTNALTFVANFVEIGQVDSKMK